MRSPGAPVSTPRWKLDLPRTDRWDLNLVRYRKRDSRATDQNSSFSPSCTDRGPLLWPVTVPNAPDSTLLFGAENTGVLLRLKASALNWRLIRSLSLVFLNSEKSTPRVKSLRKLECVRLRFPKV